MKKKSSKTEQKPREFAARPFAALKGLKPDDATARDAAPAKAPAPPPPKRAAEPDDLSLFLREMADVRRIRPAAEPSPKKEGEKAPEPRELAAAAEIRRQQEAEEHRVFADAISNLRLDVTFSDHLPEEKGEPPRPTSRLKQLKSGQIRVGLELDLHGLTKEEALESLESFIAAAHRRDQKAVLVITGKGNNSPGEPVLQGAVLSWLRERGKGKVAEFAPAPRELGGSGAIVVFLRTPGKKGD
ncbi:Smr/MutS family protein [Geobacter grbiciae]|uniref:Smr/MutS family protein n=1 Tax=Geobacter grbiciae TaxID=155042 RepID=UPI001C027F93|nr:Smr/MutS family protein [Geobacter grbiciae]MBT1075728.1 Smr/MutS family protein [Geobacter grbiciae]